MTISNLTHALTACHLPIPETAAEWQQTAATLRAHHDTLHVEEVSQAAQAMTAETALETVERLTRQRVEVEHAKTVCRQLIEGANAKAERAVTEVADDLLAQARKRFDAAAKVIAKNAAAYSPDASSEEVLSIGAQIAWSAIATASAELDEHARLWSALYSRPAGLDAFAESYDGDHWRRIDGHELFERPNRWHALIAAGYKLRLNTWAEAAAVIAGTPERELRWTHERRDGFVGMQQARA